jgi:FkbM family methyltransferase
LKAPSSPVDEIDAAERRCPLERRIGLGRVEISVAQDELVAALAAQHQRTLEGLVSVLRSEIQRATRLLGVRLNGDIFEFILRDQRIALYLPYVDTDLIQGEIAATGTFYEGDRLEYIRRFFGEFLFGKPVVDAGANIGNHTIFFSRFCKASRVFSFEPNPEVFSILRRNVELNAVTDLVTCRCCGLSSSVNHKIALDMFDHTNIGATTFEVTDSGMECVTIDSIGLDSCGLIKLDVEGFELEVLYGGVDTINRFHPLLVLETFPENKPEVFNFLEGMGYAMKKQFDFKNYLLEFAGS